MLLDDSSSSSASSPTAPLLSERAFLACCFLEPQIYASAVAESRPKTIFADARHRQVWELMGLLAERGHQIDPVSLAQLAREKDMPGVDVSFVAELVAASTTTTHWKQYLAEVLAAWRLRALKQTASKLMELAEEATSFEDAKPDMEKLLTRLSNVSLEQRDRTLKQDVEKVIESIHDELLGKKQFSNELYTGLRLFDRMFGPIDALHYEDFMLVLAAPPSTGKSSLARQIAYENLVRGKNVCAFLLETTRPMYIKSMAAQQAQVNLRELADYQKLYPAKITQMAHVLKALRDTYQDKQLFAYDEHYSIEEIESRSRHIAAKCGKLDLIVIDYLQLVSSSKHHGSREQAVAEISRRIKMLAKDLGCTIIALSQLGREGQKLKRPPELTDLRESGAIEQDADMVLMLHKPDVYHVRDKDGQRQEIDQTDNRQKYHMDFYVRKRRNGPIGRASFFFERPWTWFHDYPNVDDDGNLRRKGEY